MVVQETGSNVRRPARILEKLGEIPDVLPSVYDFVNGQFGTPNLVQAPLMKHFDLFEENWSTEVSVKPSLEHMKGMVKYFLDGYTNDQVRKNTDWDKRYKKLLVLTCQGWIREQQAAENPKKVNVFSVLDFSKALSEHLKQVETMWGVTWLTSNRPLQGQEEREVPELRNYLDKYQNGGMTGSEFWLNAAGDFLINLIRDETPTEKLLEWQQAADAFVQKA